MLFRHIFQYADFNRDMFVANEAKDIPPGVKVLDAGAGPCRYRLLFNHCDYKSQDFGRYTGSDHKYGEIDYVSDITTIPVESGSFDYVICTEVFEHIPRPDLGLQEFARILRPGGILVITAPLNSGIHMPPYHYYGGLTPYWYQNFLPSHGFELISCEANGGFFKHYGQESRRFLTLITPKHPIAKTIFFPFKAILAIWFRLAIPLICHLLDRLDKSKEFTVGYHVKARKV